MTKVFALLAILFSALFSGYIIYLLYSAIQAAKSSKKFDYLNLRKLKRLDKKLLIRNMINNPYSKVTKNIKWSVSVLFFIFLMFALGDFIYSLLGLIGIFVIIGKALIRKHKKQINLFDAQLIEAFGMLANSLKAGQSLLQALETMLANSKPPVSVEFSEVLREVKLGKSFDKALISLGQRIKSKDLSMAITSINLARETGGNLSEILLKIAYTMRERKKLYGKIDAMTTQGKSSGVILSFAPFGVLGLMYLIEPEMIGLMFTTTFGKVMLLLCIGMVLMGMHVINKIVDIKL
ncbi:MAG: type II secretion system F family protein [Elusimicrobiota bacterium]